MLIGAFEEATFSSDICSLAPGDILVFYTDGITETEAGNEGLAVSGQQSAGRGEVTSPVHERLPLNENLLTESQRLKADSHYGEDRLASCISKNAELSASALREAVVNDLTLFSGSTNPHDDRALIIIKRHI